MVPTLEGIDVMIPQSMVSGGEQEKLQLPAPCEYPKDRKYSSKLRTMHGGLEGVASDGSRSSHAAGSNTNC